MIELWAICCCYGMTRFERRIYIPLPDVQARIRLFELSIGDTPHELTKKDISKLAQE